MLDEFEDASWPDPPSHGAAAPGRRAERLPRLIGRIYKAGSASLRARLLAGLLDPLGTLGMAAIAAGAFAVFVQRRGIDGIRVSIEDAGRYSGDQIAELVRFVWQVSPESLQALAGTIADNPLGVTALSASAVLLLMQALQRPRVAGDGAAAAPVEPTPPPASR